MDASYINGLTALAGGGQSGATLISRTLNRVTTVATAADSALLPAAAPGMTLTVINAGANSMNVFPQANGDVINALAVNTALAVAANSTTLFNCVAPGVWNAK